jgi:hypothetical protein
MIMGYPNEYFDLQTAKDMKSYIRLAEKVGDNKHKTFHRENPEIKWNVYSKFGAPSVVLGLGFANKVEIAHFAHNNYSEEQI